MRHQGHAQPRRDGQTPQVRPLTSFLDSLNPEARERLLSVARPVSYVAGASLVRQGEATRGAFVLRAGEVAATVQLPGGESLTLGRLAAGAIFGEMALIERGICTATVCATENVDGWFIDHEDFRVLASHRDGVAREVQHAVTGILADRLRVLNAKVVACAAPEDRPARAFSAGTDPLAERTRSREAPFDVRGFLPRLPALERFSAEEIDELMASAAFVEVPRGLAVFVPGGPAAAAFVVLRGALEIVAVGGTREKRLAILGPGQLVGHMSVLEGARHSALAAAREDSVLLELPSEAFRGLYFGTTAAGTRMRQAVHKSLLAAIGSTNRVLSRLIAQSKLGSAGGDGAELEAAYHGQLVTRDT